MTGKFIELDRTFFPISEKEAGAEDFESRIDLGWSKPLRWQEILNQPRSVIIAEAGAGKTEEIRQQTSRLRRDGKHAFFLRLENLKDDFEFGFEGLGLGSLEDFEVWVQSDERAWFFLDSVDEAKLGDPRDFERALFNFDRALKSKREKAHIIVTSRLTWEPISDLNIVKKRLPYQPVNFVSVPNTNENEDDDSLQELFSDTPESRTADSQITEKKEAELLVYSLVRLDEERVKRFAKARSITDVDAFMEALERSDAQSFATRPKDLDDLIEYWNSNHRVGSTLELAEHSVEAKIVELNNTRAQLKPLEKSKALSGAKRIAAATSLTKWTRLAIPDQEEVKDAIPVQDILPEWDLNEAKTLLERALFDEAVYGMVHFHHRSVREYLASQWFIECLRTGSRRNISHLFFRKQYGIQVITPSLRPILPWIAIYDDKFREKALKIAPEILLQGGDSSQFPLDTRKQILSGICKKLAESKANRESFDIAVIQRFAREDMGESVYALLKQYSDHQEIQNLLLRMVWQGCYATCADHALSLAKTEDKTVYERINAIRALQASGNNEQKKDLVDYFVSESKSVKSQILSELVTSLAPSSLDVSNLSLVFEKLEQEDDRYDRNGLKHNLKELVEALKLDKLEIFADCLAGLLRREPHIDRHDCDISEEYKWLAGTAFWVCKRLIEMCSSHMLTNGMLQLLSILARYSDYRVRDYDDARKELPKLIVQWSELNNALFWSEVQARRENSDKPVNDYWNVRPWRAFWSVEGMSLATAMDWITTKELPNDKLISMSIAFVKYVGGGRERKVREKLKRMVSNIPELADQLHKHLNPPAMSTENKKWKQYDSNSKQRQKTWEKGESENRRKSKKYIQDNLEQVRNSDLAHEGRFYDSQTYLFQRMRKLSSKSGEWSQSNWKTLITDQSLEVAEAFREFLIKCSRKYRPRLRSEGTENPNKTSYGVIFGLCGLEIEASETPDWASQLSQSDAEKIVRYTFEELNGVPTWLQQFHSVFPDVVEQIFIRELEWELTENDSEIQSSYALSTLKHHCDWLHAELARPLFGLLKSKEVRDTEHLINTLQIVFSDTRVSDEELAELASERLKENLEEHNSAIWFAAWVSVDPENAIKELRLRQERQKDQEAAKQFAMRFVSALVSGQRNDRSIKSRDVFKSPKHLCELHLLLHQHIRVEDDIDRTKGGTYSPELRDDAQDARNTIYNLLTEIPGKEAFLALQRIVSEHPYIPDREWMGRHVIRRAEADADLASWSVEDVVGFEQSSEMTPHTGKQLFELTVNRLHDLKYWLEDGEDSAAGTWKRETEETKLRIIIAAWLRERSQTRYTVHQEEEQADKKRPDIRIHATGVDAPIPIELKISDNNWSGAKLFERLENQLCNDYLRDYRTTYGVFLLAYRGEKKHWKHPTTKKRMTFDQLVFELQNHVVDYIEDRKDIDEIEVIGIDLTIRKVENRD